MSVSGNLLNYIDDLKIVNDIIENADNIIFAKDINGKYTVANNAALKQYFEKSKQDVIGKTDLEIFPEAEARFNMDIDAQIKSTGNRKSFEKLVKRGDDNIYYYVVKNLVTDNRFGQTIGISGVVTDITDYKREQEAIFVEREKTSSLEYSNRIKSKFLNNISHNLRTPLMGIQGALIMDVEIKGLPFEIKKDLELFKYSAEMLLNIVDEMTAYSSLLESEITFKKKPTSLSTLVRFFDELFTHIGSEKGVSYYSTFDNKGYGMVQGDMQRLIQLFNKLLMMTVRFTPRDGSFSLHVVQEALDDGTIDVNFWVCSSGVIPEEVRGRMYDINSETPERDMLEHSSSLGLEAFISKRLVDAHGGTITYNSDISNDTKLNDLFIRNKSKRVLTEAMSQSNNLTFENRDQETMKGGAFHVNIKFQHAIQQDNFKIEKKELKILIADDNHVNQTVLKRMMSSFGKDEIFIADDGQIAYDKFVEAYEAGIPFDIVFMDIQMPQLNGIESTKLIRTYERNHKYEPKPILALTAFVSEEDRNECYSVGMTGFLGKPVTRNMLLDTLFSVGST